MSGVDGRSLPTAHQTGRWSAAVPSVADAGVPGGRMVNFVPAGGGFDSNGRSDQGKFKKTRNNWWAGTAGTSGATKGRIMTHALQKPSQRCFRSCSQKRRLHDFETTAVLLLLMEDRAFFKSRTGYHSYGVVSKRRTVMCDVCKRAVCRRACVVCNTVLPLAACYISPGNSKCCVSIIVAEGSGGTQLRRN